MPAGKLSTEHGHLRAKVDADPADLRLGDSAVGSERLDQAIPSVPVQQPDPASLRWCRYSPITEVSSASIGA